MLCLHVSSLPWSSSRFHLCLSIPFLLVQIYPQGPAQKLPPLSRLSLPLSYQPEVILSLPLPSPDCLYCPNHTLTYIIVSLRLVFSDFRMLAACPILSAAVPLHCILYIVNSQCICGESKWMGEWNKGPDSSGFIVLPFCIAEAWKPFEEKRP